MRKFQSSNVENHCYEENGFASEQEINIDFHSNKLCDKTIELFAAINNFAANYACDGRGKLYRKITRSAGKAKDFFIKNQRKWNLQTEPSRIYHRSSESMTYSEAITYCASLDMEIAILPQHHLNPTDWETVRPTQAC